MRAIVAVIAVVAAAVVAGVVYATRQDPAQPKARCKDGVPAGIYPVASTANVPAVQQALAKGPKRAARALEGLAAENPTDPVVQFNYGTALYCAGFDAEAVQAFRKAKRDGRDTRYQVVVRQPPSPAVLQQADIRCSSTAVAIHCSSRVRSRNATTTRRPRNGSGRARRSCIRTTQTRRSPQRSGGSTWTT